MSVKSKKADRTFLIIVFFLILAGLAMFISAALGILNRDIETFRSILMSQLVFGLGAGLIGMYVLFKFNYKILRNLSFIIFLLTLGLTVLVFVPGLGVEHFGAKRWLSFQGVSFQPVEALKFGFIIMLAACLSWVKDRVQRYRYGIFPLFVLLSGTGAVLLSQPDTKSFILISFT